MAETVTVLGLIEREVESFTQEATRRQVDPIAFFAKRSEKIQLEVVPRDVYDVDQACFIVYLHGHDVGVVIPPMKRTLDAVGVKSVGKFFISVDRRPDEPIKHSDFAMHCHVAKGPTGWETIQRGVLNGQLRDR